MATGTTVNQVSLITFFNAATANGSSAVMVVPFSEGLVKVAGTFGGATVSFFVMDAYGNYVPVCFSALNSSNQPIPVAITSPCDFGLSFVVQNENVYASISGATGTTSITVTLQRTH